MSQLSIPGKRKPKAKIVTTQEIKRERIACMLAPLRRVVTARSNPMSPRMAPLAPTEDISPAKCYKVSRQSRRQHRERETSGAEQLFDNGRNIHEDIMLNPMCSTHHEGSSEDQAPPGP